VYVVTEKEATVVEHQVFQYVKWMVEYSCVKGVLSKVCNGWYHVMVLKLLGAGRSCKLEHDTPSTTSVAAMSPRQQQATDASQVDLEEDENISVTREGDEIMEEAEEQEDGYSTFISCLYNQPPLPPSFIYGGHAKPI
jgi:hypothetical protein